MTAIFGPEGLRLMVTRSLAADIEVRLTVAWPPLTRLLPDGGSRLMRGALASDFPEPVAPGYKRQPVVRGNWTLSVSEEGVITAEAPMVVFRFDGPLDNARSIVGHLLVDTTSGTLLWAERYGVSVPVPEAGELEVVPVYVHGPQGAG